MFKSLAEAVTGSPLSWLGSDQAQQFLMLGLEDAGKTTLLYRLKIPGYKKDEIIKDMNFLKKENQRGQHGDPGYHYEDFRSNIIGNYGIWEIPGNKMMQRMWPMFYRHLHFRMVLFVVDAFSKTAFDLSKANLEKLTQARDSLHQLLNEDELRQAVFFVVLNVDTTEGVAKTEDQEQQEKTILEMLDAPWIEKQPQFKERFRTVWLNCATITHAEPEWEKLLQDFSDIQVRLRLNA